MARRRPAPTPRTDDTIRLVLVEPRALVGVGVREVLDREPGIEIVAEVRTADEALPVVEQTAPDVVLVDVGLRESEVTGATRRLREGAPGSAIVVVGGASGAGFGWQDVNVYKIGFEYQYNSEITLRAGYSRNDNPIRAQDVTFNILAPGVVQDHVALGFTYKTKSGGELTMFYMHAFENSVTGPSLFTNLGVPGGNETIKMYQDSIGIAYGWKM